MFPIRQSSLRSQYNAVVYQLIAPNGDFYIGSTTDVDKRYMQHATQVANGCHNSLMTKHVEQYGFDFTIDILAEGLSRQQAYDAETQMLQKLGHKPGSLNIAMHGKFGDTKTHNPNAKSIIAKAVSTVLARNARLSDNEHERIYHGCHGTANG